jgi:hypothetical protein
MTKKSQRSPIYFYAKEQMEKKGYSSIKEAIEAVYNT